MFQEKEYTHCVVRFDEETNIDNGPVADLIPIGWLCGEETTCSYPRNADHKNLIKWVETSKKPNKSWLQSQKITVIKKTTSFKKGLSRLEKYMDTLDPGTTTASEMSGTEDSSASLSQCKSNLLAAIASSSSADDKDDNGEKGSRIDKTIPIVDDWDEIQKIISAPSETNSTGQKRKAVDESEDYNVKKNLIKMYEKAQEELKRTYNSTNFEVTKRLEQCETTLLINIGQPMGKGVTSDLKSLEVKLPIVELQVFEKFDASLATSNENAIALKNVMQSYARGKNTVTFAIRAILSEVISKDVQVKFSGKGKAQPKTASKKDFSSTNTYKCMREIIMKQLGSTTNEKQIGEKTGKWLKGASDRDGGRQARYKKLNNGQESENA